MEFAGSPGDPAVNAGHNSGMSLSDSRPRHRRLNPADSLVDKFDRLLKSATGPHLASRPYPGAQIPETVTDPATRRRIAGLMRVNHAGEICAQALYHGQAATAKQDGVRVNMQEAAQEEVDHLAWCAQRLNELDARPSILDPLWYAGSFAIGALAGISGDRRSLGFVAETEKQVVAHLHSHLAQLPEDDARTRAVLEQMASDEARHGGDALNKGGELPPAAIQRLMKLTAKVMTFASQRI
jgi:ubiquinone biosynthesis monooxygenase Coq7